MKFSNVEIFEQKLYNNSIYLIIFKFSKTTKHTMQSPFIRKLKKILEDRDYENVIGWTRKSTSIEIKDEKQFEDLVLSKHFRHSHLTSFIRQLNLYGFRKVRSSNAHIFTHQALESGKLLDDIIPKRKLRRETSKEQKRAREYSEESGRKESQKKMKEKKEEIQKKGTPYEQKIPNTVSKIEQNTPHRLGPQHEMQTNPWVYMIPPQPIQYGLPPFPFYHYPHHF